MIIVKYIFLQLICWHGGYDVHISFHYSRIIGQILTIMGEPDNYD